MSMITRLVDMCTRESLRAHGKRLISIGWEWITFACRISEAEEGDRGGFHLQIYVVS